MEPLGRDCAQQHLAGAHWNLLLCLHWHQSPQEHGLLWLWPLLFCVSKIQLQLLLLIVPEGELALLTFSLLWGTGVLLGLNRVLTFDLNQAWDFAYEISASAMQIVTWLKGVACAIMRIIINLSTLTIFLMLRCKCMVIAHRWTSISTECGPIWGMSKCLPTTIVHVSG